MRALGYSQKPGSECACGSCAMIARMPSVFRINERAVTVDQVVEDSHAGAKAKRIREGILRGTRSRSRHRIQDDEGLYLTPAAGLERVLRSHASRHFHLHLSSAIHAGRWAAASSVHADFAQPKSTLLGRRQRHPVSDAAAGVKVAN